MAWFYKWAAPVGVALSVAACGGGDGSGPSGLAGGGGGAASSGPVEVAALLDRVESYQPPPQSLPQKALLSPSQGSRPVPAVVRLPRLEPLKSALPDAAKPGVPLQIGTARQVQLSSNVQQMRALLQFGPGAPGEGEAAAVSFTSPGAAGVRLGLLVTELPANARVRGYSQGGETVFDLAGQEILETVRRNRDAGDVSDAGRTYWLPIVDSEEATLEIALPAGASADSVKVSVPLLSHVKVKPREMETLMIGQSGSCEIDVSCHADASVESRATAKMVFVAGGYSYLCSGTLLNDSQSSGIPYFLTAEHCISTQTAASSLVTYWFYKSAACGSRVVNPEVKTLASGAILLYSSTETDTSLLRLGARPPEGATYAGWSAAPPQFGQELVGVHHPRGDLQKFSRGLLAGFTNCSTIQGEYYSCRPALAATAKYLDTEWTLGTVESGSSGSGLFASIAGGRYLVGQLKGGTASCEDPTGTNSYGRFDVAYNASLFRWLSPSQLNPSSGSVTSPSGTRVPVHRFYNRATATHFYTPIAAERDYVLLNFPSYAYEGVAFYGYPTHVTGSYPVYRLYNRSNRRHFYTMAKDERDAVLARFPEVTDEGIGWYAQWEAGGSASPMYRFYNASTGSHFYTLSEAEKSIVLKEHPTFQLEGVAYQAWTTP